MNPGSALLHSFLATLGIIFDVITTIVFVWVVLSWFIYFGANSSFRWKHRKIFVVITQLEEILSRMINPVLRPFRKLLPAWKTGGIDWSPMLLLLSIFFVRYFISMLLYGR